MFIILVLPSPIFITGYTLLILIIALISPQILIYGYKVKTKTDFGYKYIKLTSRLSFIFAIFSSVSSGFIVITGETIISFTSMDPPISIKNLMKYYLKIQIKKLFCNWVIIRISINKSRVQIKIAILVDFFALLSSHQVRGLTP